mmetsp:Transcript_21625/g.45145  ORF Transcript_21625/g.45145 Transcript_21625/m.45145 type:complete len:354 (+) Transcript_21625:379-1440(+)
MTSLTKLATVALSQSTPTHTRSNLQMPPPRSVMQCRNTAIQMAMSIQGMAMDTRRSSHLKVNLTTRWSHLPIRKCTRITNLVGQWRTNGETLILHEATCTIHSKCHTCLTISLPLTCHTTMLLLEPLITTTSTQPRPTVDRPDTWVIRTIHHMLLPWQQHQLRDRPLLPLRMALLEAESRHPKRRPKTAKFNEKPRANRDDRCPPTKYFSRMNAPKCSREAHRVLELRRATARCRAMTRKKRWALLPWLVSFLPSGARLIQPNWSSTRNVLRKIWSDTARKWTFTIKRNKRRNGRQKKAKKSRRSHLHYKHRSQKKRQERRKRRKEASHRNGLESKSVTQRPRKETRCPTTRT